MKKIRESKDNKKDRQFATESLIPVKSVYKLEDLSGFSYKQELGDPGQYPYTRGIHEKMYREQIWTMRLLAGYGLPEDMNKRNKYLISQGQTGLALVFDQPTYLGYDSDDPMAEGFVGQTGSVIDTLKDMETCLDGIPLDQVSISINCSDLSGLVTWAMYLAVAEKQGTPISKLRGTLQNDILSEYLACKKYTFPVEPGIKIVTDIISYCCHYLPLYNPISICSQHMQEQGANPVQALAFTLSNAIAYTKACLNVSLNIDEFAPKFSFFFDVGSDFFEEIAKLRAARRMYSTIMKERFRAKNPRSFRMRFHCQTSGAALTTQQPENNIIRTTLHALAAILGGTQSLHTDSYDEAYGEPTEKAATIALRTQQIIAHETGIINTADPLGGSYFVEYLTNEIEKRAFEYIEKIEGMGGSPEAIKKGYIQNEIAEEAYRKQKELEEKRKIIVGLNKYEIDEEAPIEFLRVDHSVEEIAKKRLAEVKRERNSQKVKTALNKLEAACEDNINIVPAILEAVKSYATIGEIKKVLVNVFGEYEESLDISK